MENFTAGTVPAVKAGSLMENWFGLPSGRKEFPTVGKNSFTQGKKQLRDSMLCASKNGWGSDVGLGSTPVLVVALSRCRWDFDAKSQICAVIAAEKQLDRFMQPAAAVRKNGNPRWPRGPAAF